MEKVFGLWESKIVMKIFLRIKPLDCHRKELIGYQSAKDILFAIKLNIDNLLHELKNKNYLIESPSMGISFDIPLDVLESIFDFWLDIYKNQVA